MWDSDSRKLLLAVYWIQNFKVQLITNDYYVTFVVYCRNVDIPLIQNNLFL